MNKVYAILLWFALLFCHNGLLAQNGGVIVTGKVYAEDEPEGFIGATVIEQDKNGRIYSSALTDFNGNFSLKIKNPNNSLNFSFVGYKKLTVSIGNKRKFDVKLESQNVMKEVTVKASKLVGGGGLAIPEWEYSGAMQKFNTKAIEGVSVASIDDALQGRMAGVSVLSGSGDPSGDNTIRVRGINSITAETGPLVVIDGFIGGSLQSLNPADIASIEVLKDASATAVYGSRGANGVILVTTKNPEKDKLTVSFNAFANIKTVAKYPDNLSPYEYANLVNDYGKEYFGYGDNHFYSPEQLEAFKSGKAGYDYSREIFRSPAVTQNYELSIAGGGEKTTFLASLRYQDDQGIIKESGSQIYSWRLKVDTKIKNG